MAVKGAGSFTPEDAELFSQLGRLRELKQLRSWVLDRDKVPAVTVMGESGVGKTSLLRAGLTFILNQGETPIPHAYWEADPRRSQESLLRKIEAELGTRDLESLPPRAACPRRDHDETLAAWRETLTEEDRHRFQHDEAEAVAGLKAAQGWT